MFSGIGGFELGIQQAWNVNYVKNQESSTETTNQPVNPVSETIKNNGDYGTSNEVELPQEDLINNAENKYLKPTEESVLVAENQHQSSLPLTIKITTGQQNDESSVERDIHINSLLKEVSQTPTNYYATTATFQKVFTDNAPICVGYSEIDKYAIQIYEKHFPTHTNFGDATKINAEELPDFDLLVGGFPCQAFSIAGKRLGLDDTRGTLFYDIARIAKEKRPQHLLLENVKGLLSHDNGRTFKLIISTFAELGYNMEWQVLNSKNFGVPQNRERVFIIGHLGACCGRQVFPLTKSTRDYPDFCQPLGTLTSRYPASQREGAYPEETRNGSPAIRRLTPLECERLQSYPDNWTLTGYDNSSLIRQVEDGTNPIRVTNECIVRISDTQRYKTLGNGVTVNVIKELIERLYL